MIYEEAIVDGVLCWRSSPRDCKGHGPWIPKTPQELTAMLMEARHRAAQVQPMIVSPVPVVYPVPPVVLPMPQWPDPPYKVTC